MSILKLTDITLTDKRVLIREDFNVPMSAGKINSDARLRAALPTIQYVLAQNPKTIILLSHLGRPNEGELQAEFSLAPVAEALSTLLKKPVRFLSQWIDGFIAQPGEIVLCENVRMQPGEKKNSSALSKKMAQLCDVFVMDAFATAHRAESSTVGIAQFAPIACAGLLLAAELDALEKALLQPAKPLTAVIGGSKVSTKLTVLETLLQKVDQLIVGGGIANTFLAAAGFPVGKSLYEPDLIATAKQLHELAKQRGSEIPLPIDVVVAKEFSATAQAYIKNVTEVADDDMILDIGPQTAAHYDQILKNSQTILWNGPVGVFELAPFEKGTQTLAATIATSGAFSIAGGGDTLAAIEKYHIEDKISYISTGGGAFLEFVEGKELPAVKMLQIRAKTTEQ